MDGDGSIQVNHSRNKNLQYRLVIKLLNLESNYNMLVTIAKIIGGTVRIVGNNVIWVIVNQLTISSNFIPVKINYNLNKLVKLYVKKAIRLYRTPVLIVSDRDPRFTS